MEIKNEVAIIAKETKTKLDTKIEKKKKILII